MNSNNQLSAAAMKLCLHTSVDNEASNLTGCAYLEIDAAAAQALLDLIGLTQVFREQAHRAGLICPLYTISLGCGDKIPRFRLIDIPFADGVEPDNTRPVLILPADFSADSVAAEREHCVECHRIAVDPTRIHFTAYPRHGDDTFTTADLDAGLLQAIAANRDCGLPKAALAPVDSSSTNLN